MFTGYEFAIFLMQKVYIYIGTEIFEVQRYAHSLFDFLFSLRQDSWLCWYFPHTQSTLHPLLHNKQIFLPCYATHTHTWSYASTHLCRTFMLLFLSTVCRIYFIFLCNDFSPPYSPCPLHPQFYVGFIGEFSPYLPLVGKGFWLSV